MFKKGDIVISKYTDMGRMEVLVDPKTNDPKGYLNVKFIEKNDADSYYVVLQKQVIKDEIYLRKKKLEKILDIKKPTKF